MIKLGMALNATVYGAIECQDNLGYYNVYILYLSACI